ncbi:MAG: YdeI/OmpD-associated family protein [Gloeomargaritaceae cyanobacterium C42_A2020_066]|nr:YdeI/OmpD-associated family protein [Gloeomargaritaceae cyanobacterium C42_A2020_066]
MALNFEERLEQVYALSRQVWRDWLTVHHQTQMGVWLVYYKVGSGRPSVRYPEAVQEALCFGWIDSKVKSLDGERYQQVFTPRKPRSVWSKLNKGYVAELQALGLLRPAGLRVMEAAQQDGSWFSLDACEALVIPEDLAQALAQYSAAQAHFESYPASLKKAILGWIAAAKRPETRQRRIQRTVEAAGRQQNPL